VNHRRHAPRQMQARGVILQREQQKLSYDDGYISPSFDEAGLTITRRRIEPNIVKQ